MYVHPDHRRQGYFKELYAHVRRDAEAAGAAGLRLYADDGNVRAHTTVRYIIWCLYFRCCPLGTSRGFTTRATVSGRHLGLGHVAEEGVGGTAYHRKRQPAQPAHSDWILPTETE